MADCQRINFRFPEKTDDSTACITCLFLLFHDQCIDSLCFLTAYKIFVKETLKALSGDPSVRKLLKKGLRASVYAGKVFGGTGTQTLCVAEFQGRTADGLGFGKDTDTDSRSQEKEK